MATIDITDDSFPTIYEDPKNDIILLDFWAPWCGPCHQFSPIFEKVAEQNPDIVFGKINTEVEQKLSAYFAIRSIPTLVVMREQINIHQQSGVVGKEALQQLVQQVSSLDMEEIKKKLADAGEL